jgi:4-aminobutyrate aminotransferase
MVGLELNEADGWMPSRAAAKGVLEEAKKRSLLVGMGGFHGNVIRMAPPLSVTEAECARALAILEECFEAVF